MAGIESKEERRSNKHSRRVRSFIRRLGLSHCRHDGERGLILLQVDGLSLFALKDALGKRAMPFLSKLLRRRSYRLSSFLTGMPATTPAFQLGLFYGVNDHVPGFRWIEKASGQVRNMKGAFDATEVERIASERAPGLLTGGGCHCSLFRGGAAHASLTMSNLQAPEQRAAALSRWDLLALALVNVGVLLRVLVASLWETALEAYDQLRAEYEGRLTRGEWPFILVRGFANVAFREWSTLGVLVDIVRGAPAVYANFYGYDELAHHRGPLGFSTRVALRAIDRRIRRIFREARDADRPYDIFIFSDHGQVPTIPFSRLYGAPFEQALAEGILARVAEPPEGMTDAEEWRLRTLAHVQHELMQVLPKPFSFLPAAIGRYLVGELPHHLTTHSYEELASVVVMPTSDLAHLYVTSVARKLSMAEMRAQHEPLVEALQRHPGIWAVAGVGQPDEQGRPTTELQGARGSGRIWEDGRVEVLGEDPFEAAVFPEGTAESIFRLVHLPHSGDLLLFGARHGGRAVNFQEEIGGHGGPYAEEQTAFILAPPELDFAFEKVRGSPELYRLFWNRYRASGETGNRRVA